MSMEAGEGLRNRRPHGDSRAADSVEEEMKEEWEEVDGQREDEDGNILREPFESSSHGTAATSSSAQPHTNKTETSQNVKSPRSAADTFFECNICLETVVDPVLTLCGHLYCWTCLYRWLVTNHTNCPVCKAGVTKENVIPVYGRGSDQIDPRSKVNVEDLGDIPSRPAGQRPTPMQVPNQTGGFPMFPTHQAQFGGFSFSAGVGFFPSLFGLQFQNLQPQNGQEAPFTRMNRGRPLTPEEEQQALLSKLLLLLGIFVIFCLMLF